VVLQPEQAERARPPAGQQACGKPAVASSDAARARDVLMDYLHGAALSGPKAAERALTAGWPLLWGGLQAAL
jgi:hypothetical protein